MIKRLLFIVGSGSTKAQFGNPAAAQRAALLLGTTVDALSRAIFNPVQTLSARGSFRWVKYSLACCIVSCLS